MQTMQWLADKRAAFRSVPDGENEVVEAPTDQQQLDLVEAKCVEDSQAKVSQLCCAGEGCLDGSRKVRNMCMVLLLSVPSLHPLFFFGSRLSSRVNGVVDQAVSVSVVVVHCWKFICTPRSTDEHSRLLF